MHSLRARFTILLVVLVTTVMAMGGYLSYLRAQSSYLVDLTSRISQTKERLEANLQQSLWVYDAAQIRSAIEAERNNDILVGIQLLTPDGRFRYSLARIDGNWVTGEKMPVADQIHRVNLEYSHDG
jgi:hypothetical protein